MRRYHNYALGLEMHRSPSFVRLCAPIAIAFSIGGLGYSVQTPQSCLSGVSMWGCTTFGYGDDNNVAYWASVFVGGTEHLGNSLCNDVWDDAQLWLGSYMTAVYDSAFVGGNERDALSTYNQEDWGSGWIGRWIRDSGRTIMSRANQLSGAALHEAMHKACDTNGGQYDVGEFEFDCGEDPEEDLEDEIESWLGYCYGEPPN